MTWATPPFTIGGVPVELPQSTGLTVSYEDEGGVVTHRMGSGKPIRKSYWTRVKATVSGDGYLPAGLSDISWTEPMLVQLPMPRSCYSATNSIEIPAKRRTDAGAPTAVAWVNGFPVKTAVTLNTNTATATPVGSATGYTFSYYPECQAYVTKTESSDRTSGKHTWNLTIEEI